MYVCMNIHTHTHTHTHTHIQVRNLYADTVRDRVIGASGTDVFIWKWHTGEWDHCCCGCLLLLLLLLSLLLLLLLMMIIIISITTLRYDVFSWKWHPPVKEGNGRQGLVILAPPSREDEVFCWKWHPKPLTKPQSNLLNVLYFLHLL